MTDLQIGDAFTFEAMSPVSIKSDSPISATKSSGANMKPSNSSGKIFEYDWSDFVLPFNEITLVKLEKLRSDLHVYMSDGNNNNSRDNNVFSEISLGISGIEILLSVLDRSGTNIFEEQLNMLASENLDTALQNDVDGAGKVSSALTKDNILTVAIRLQELCDQRLEILQQVNMNNDAELSRIINDGEDGDESFMTMDNTRLSMSYNNDRGLENDILIEDLEMNGSIRSANVSINKNNNDKNNKSIDDDIKNKSSLVTVIGADNHAPAQYPLPGQWESRHYRRNSLDAIKAKARNAWVGLNMAQHRHHIDQYLGTCDGIPMARWAGSLRDNAKYANRVKGIKPMRFSTALGSDGRSLTSSRLSKNNATGETIVRATVSSNDIKSACKEMLYNPDLKTKEIEKKLRKRKEQINRILKDAENTKIDSGKYKYPKPGQTKSKFYKKNSIDAKRAHQRPYVGMNMNDVRMHIAPGHGDGKAASHWVGSLRSDANGANGGNNSIDNIFDNKNSNTSQNGDVQSSEATTRNNNNNSVEDENGMKESKSNSTSSKYIGGKTSALMSGVPHSMRRYRVDVTNGVTSSPSKAYMILANALATPLINEHASKFRFRDDTPYTASRLHIKATDKIIKEKEIEKRNRRNAYGDKAAARFRKMKEEKKARKLRQKRKGSPKVGN
jgi:hypothetical protein